MTNLEIKWIHSDTWEMRILCTQADENIVVQIVSATGFTPSVFFVFPRTYIDRRRVLTAYAPSNVQTTFLIVVAGNLSGRSNTWSTYYEDLPPLCYFIAEVKKSKFCGLSLQANYADRATAACQRNQCQLLRIEGAMWSAWRNPTAVISGF
jgi:hypothetical protein